MTPDQRIIPFSPEILSLMNGDLEKLLIAVPEERHTQPERLSYDVLPDQISSGGIDLYATWLAEQTFADPGLRERHASAALLDKPRRLLYQPIPTIGTKFYVMDPPSFRPPGFTGRPVDFHTHPSLNPFSEGDQQRMAGAPATIDPTVYVVSNRIRTYMMMLTKQTPWQHPDNIRMDLNNATNRFTFEYPSVEFIMEKRLGRKVIYEEYTKVVEALDYKGDEYNYCKNFHKLLGMSEKNRWGFYFSDKNGVFKRLTSSNIVMHIEETIEKLVNEIFGIQ